ncbi:hypothetical protein CSUI_010487 [Cystoisospora suis]|uniref:Transmembrane protein n=1 Tax=Cystoisospora suis TaxID=483139 RepID=A0A2C6KH92_9APIC|nr:hypothetical protein CSUI_010487 [Cystoisospora suis]
MPQSLKDVSFVFFLFLSSSWGLLFSSRDKEDRQSVDLALGRMESTRESACTHACVQQSFGKRS